MIISDLLFRQNQYIEFGKRSTIDASLFNFLVPTIRKQQVWTPRTLREIAASRCSSMFYAFGSLVWSFLNDVLLFCFSDAWHGLFPLDCLLTIVYLPNTWSQYARDRLTLLTARRWQMTSSWPLVQATGPWAEFGTWAWRKPGLTVWSDDSTPKQKGRFGSVWYIPFVNVALMFDTHLLPQWYQTPKLQALSQKPKKGSRQVPRGHGSLLEIHMKNWHHYWFQTHHTRSETPFNYIAALSHSMW